MAYSIIVSQYKIKTAPTAFHFANLYQNHHPLVSPLSIPNEPGYKLYIHIQSKERYATGKGIARRWVLSSEVNSPCILYYHGGCFVSGGCDSHDPQLRQLALEKRL